MLCRICKKKDATVHVTQIVGDKMQKQDLCADCAKQTGVLDKPGIELTALLEQLRKSPGQENRLQ